MEKQRSTLKYTMASELIAVRYRHKQGRGLPAKSRSAGLVYDDMAFVGGFDFIKKLRAIDL
jgi:hypothetical protein